VYALEFRITCIVKLAVNYSFTCIVKHALMPDMKIFIKQQNTNKVYHMLHHQK